MTDQWQPGRLYAPGDIVQPRITDPITQGALNNPDFEGGDTGWGTGGDWSISTGSAFAGSWKAQFTNGGTKLVILADVGFERAYATQDAATYAENNVDADLVAAGNGIFVAVNESNGSNFTSVDGETWTDRTGSNPWATPTFSCLHFDSLTSLFILCEATDRTYYTSSDGITWTAREFPGGVDAATSTPPQGFATDGTTLVMLRGDGETHYSTDAISWTPGTLMSSGGHAIVYASHLATFVAFNGDYDVHTSADGIATFVEQTSADLNTTINSNNQLSVGYNGSRFVAMSNSGLSEGATTDKLATSTDGISWTARNAFHGNWVRYSAVLEKFVYTGSGNATDRNLNTSTDGVSWTQNEFETAGTTPVAFPTADLVVSAAASTMENTARLSISPGQTVSCAAKTKISGASMVARIGLSWHGVADVLIQTDYSDSVLIGTTGAYVNISSLFVAPEGALTVSVTLLASGGGANVLFDNVTISQTDPVTISEFLFKAVQASPGYSDSDEPVWPTVLGNTVVDNQVTWEAIAANRVVWRAFPILQSGAVEPTFPAVVQGEVPDNTISWRATSRRVLDENCPNTKQVAIAAGKVFAADGDIVSFSATVNPQDWSSPNDAGFIPTGMNPYGSQNVSGLGLYRSNLVVFTPQGFQMWQVDADPSNMALLDAVPVGIPDGFHQGTQPVQNDLVFVSEAGIRNMGIAGASTNLQAGSFGKNVDALVLAKIEAGDVPNALFWPGAGQYWAFFDEEAFVLTINGGKQDMSWSRYVFPSAVDDWTILGTTLYLRSGDEIWRVGADATLDQQTAPGVGTDFTGSVWWHYLDFGALGDQKMMHGFDLVGEGACTITFGYDQSNTALVTSDYVVTDIETLPGTMIPMPISGPSFQMRLDFSADQDWKWEAAAIYLDDQRTTS